MTNRSLASYVGSVGRMIRAAGRQTAHMDPEDLARLIALQPILRASIREAVAGQRRSGITWDSIAEATGTSRQAAIKKWSAYCEPD